MFPPALDLSKGRGLGIYTYMPSTQGGGTHEEGMAHGLIAHTDVVNI